eukprot:484271-Lingulodinium_polyedra.AAC.1
MHRQRAYRQEFGRMPGQRLLGILLRLRLARAAMLLAERGDAQCPLPNALHHRRPQRRLQNEL